jgi:hypothetical protein
MRIILLFLVIAGLAFAPFPLSNENAYDSFEDELLACDKTCCTSNAGTWDTEYEYCDIDPTDGGYNRYSACYNQCMQNSSGDIGSSAFCCGPGLGLLILTGFVLKRN